MKEEFFQIVKDSTHRFPYSNCMKSIEELEHGMAEGSVAVIYDLNPVILVERKEEFSQLYYFFDKALGKPTDVFSGIDWDTIKGRIVGYDPLYADITVRGDFEYQGSVFERLGFKPFRTYLRMNCGNEGLRYNEILKFLEPGAIEIVDVADINDFNSIRTLIKHEPTFDVMSDHLPDDEELKRLLLKQEVLKIVLNGEIGGVYIFEDTGTKTYGRMLCVAEKFQNHFIGYVLLASYHSRHIGTASLFEIWLYQDNRRSYKLQSRLGYKEDGLKNYVFKI